jgi:hypothetical protein
MQCELFSFPEEDESRLQPTVVTCSPDELIERQFGTSIADAVANALWRASYTGNLSNRLNLSAELISRFIRLFRNDSDFGAALARGADPRGNLEHLLVSWVKDSR